MCLDVDALSDLDVKSLKAWKHYMWYCACSQSSFTSYKYVYLCYMYVIIQNLQHDQRAELEMYVQTRADLNDLYSATQRNLDTETKRRSQLQQELDMLKSVRAEKEVGKGLMCCEPGVKVWMHTFVPGAT